MIFLKTLNIPHLKTLTAVVLFFSFSFSGNTVMAQDTPGLGSWTTATLEYGLNKRWSGFVSEEFRLKEDFSRLNLFYTCVGFEYKITKNIKSSLAYRFTQKFKQDNFFSFRHRVQWDVTVKKGFGKFDLSYRHRLQSEVKDVYSSDIGRLPDWFSRSKFQVKYDTDKPYTPYFSVELRYQIQDHQNPVSNLYWHRIRYQGGLDYKLNSRNNLGLYYLLQDEFDTEDPARVYVIGLEYTFKL